MPNRLPGEPESNGGRYRGRHPLGTPCRIVHNRRLDRQGMRSVGYSQEEMALKLRLGGIAHLGQVKGAYVESNGEVSIFTYPPGQVKSGLPISPPWDVRMSAFFSADRDVADRPSYSCAHCGHTIRLQLRQFLPVCALCDHSSWVYSWYSPEEHDEYDTADPSAT